MSTESGQGQTDVILRTESPRGLVSEEKIAHALNCDFNEFSIHCFKDNMPVDGAAVRVFTVLNSNKTISVEKEVIYYDRRAGKQVHEIENVAKGLKKTL